MERLASGKKINSASDDVAGFAISERMTSQIRGLSKVVQNVNDAISLLETAQASTREITGIVQRIRELTVQG
jgi:flagellin